MFRYVHTNIIAKDSQRLISFYKKVFNCKSIGETRDLRGDWLDKLTGVPNAHIVGPQINRCGLAHLAFEVDDVEETLELLLKEGGAQIGEVVKADYEDGRKAVFVYAADCEGNIIELQNWG